MSNTTCIIDGCDRTNIVARRLCNMHYHRMYLAGRLGEFSKPPRRKVDVMERVQRIGWTVTPAGCWEWKGSRSTAGYGQVNSGEKSPAGHALPALVIRVVMEARCGPLTSADCVLHSCDNPPCVNPAHLRVGSHAENSRDAVARRRTANGERRPQAKLTDTQVDEIRSLYASGKYTQKALASMFSVANSNISLIVNYKRRPEKTYPVPVYYSAQRDRAA